MYGKIIIKNVARNIKDYGIYFITLLISVAVFYSFNAIDSQPVIKEAMESNGNMMGTLIPMIHMLSKFVAVMLAFLIIYANNFLLKRRKKELGIYMILGMSEGKMSLLFVGETVLIGIFSVIAGIGVGCLLAQGISIFAIKMFAYDLAQYRFVFSVGSLKETLICFAIIFFVVVVFNVHTINKVKLIDMLTASRKNENMSVDNSGILWVALAGSVGIYGMVGYLLYFKNIFDFDTNQPYICFLGICIATAMLIYSVAGIVLNILQKKKTWYLKGINSFLVRQISSKMQTNFATITVVSLLLTGTICIVSIGMGMADSMNQLSGKEAPFDLVVYDESAELSDGEKFYEKLEKKGLPLDKALEGYDVINCYEDEKLTYSDILSDLDALNGYDKENGTAKDLLPIVSVSEYNRALELQGEEPITLESGTFQISNCYKGTKKNIQEWYNEQKSLTIFGQTLRPGSTKILEYAYYLAPAGLNDAGTIIVSDELLKTETPEDSIFMGVYKQGYDETPLVDVMVGLMGNLKSQFSYYTKNLVNNAIYGTYAMAAFVCCYIGVILLIICVAVLSLQQLTETNDNVIRYQLLGKLGVERKIQNSALLRQIFVYFGIPLLVAIVYAMAGMPKAIEKVETKLGLQFGAQAAAIIVILIIVYGSYFLLTYLSCRRMIAEEKVRTED